MEIHQWLSATKAAEFMVRNIVTLAECDTLSQAASVLLNEQISGAPVANKGGVCVGVLSASDLIGAEEHVAKEQAEIADSTFFNSNLALPASVYQERLEAVRDKLAPAAEQQVKRFMTSDVVSVTGDTPLSTVVQNMVDAHVHRVLVLDEDRQPQGIISTTDILAALLRAARRPSATT